MPELTTLQRIAAGETEAVRECMDRYGGLVWSLARRFLYSSNEAEDAVQEIFLDLWKHAGRFDPNVAAEATYVAMIARRRLIDRVRKRTRGGNTTVQLEEDAINQPSREAAPPIWKVRIVS